MMQRYTIISHGSVMSTSTANVCIHQLPLPHPLCRLLSQLLVGMQPARPAEYTDKGLEQ